MADEEMKATIKVRPYYGDETPIAPLSTPAPERQINFVLEPWTPKAPVIPPIEEVPGGGYYSPPAAPLPVLTESPIYAKRPAIVNIETTGLDPDQNRIIIIGVKDATDLSDNWVVFAGWEERDVIAQFMEHWVANGYGEIVGYNGNFDVVFLLHKCVRYGINAREFFSCEQVDVMVLYQKGQMKFVNSGNKPKKLNTLMKDILGIVTPYQDEEALVEVADGKMDKFLVINQYKVVGTTLLYALWTRTTENSFGGISLMAPGAVEEGSVYGRVIQCENCRAGATLEPGQTEWTCAICGQHNKL